MNPDGTTSVYIIRNGEVESSSVILVKGSDDVWQKWDVEAAAIANDLKSHSYFGLKELFDLNKKFGWDSSLLKQDAVDEHVYSYGESTFWVPCWSEWALRRTWLNITQKWAEWETFLSASNPDKRVRTVKEFKDFIVQHPQLGWRWAYMRQDAYDLHLWNHAEGKELDQLWFPDLSNAPPFEFADPKGSVQLLVTCVNTLGCATLTEGKAYALKGNKDDLVQVVDDAGELRDFLPERFTGVTP